MLGGLRIDFGKECDRSDDAGTTSPLPAPSSTLTKSYTWGLDLSDSLQYAGGVGGLLAVTDGSSSYYPTYDGNGNVSEYLTAAGMVAAHFEYDPFGRTTVDTDAVGQFAHRFSTKPLDATNGLYYYGYRWYDPLAGGWPSRDPISESGGMNIYAFVGSDPIGWIDFLGLKKPKCTNPEDQEKLDAMWDEARKNGGEMTQSNMDSIENSEYPNTVNFADGGGSGVRPRQDSKHGKGAGPAFGSTPHSSNGRGTGAHMNFDSRQGESTGYSSQSIFEHELEHMARINEGNNPENLGEREKRAIDAANEGRRNRGENERPYDHPRITDEQRKQWEKEKNCECD